MLDAHNIETVWKGYKLLLLIKGLVSKETMGEFNKIILILSTELIM